MSEAEQFSSLVDEIYDAALDPALWVGVLGRVMRFVDGAPAANSAGEDRQHNGRIAEFFQQLSPAGELLETHAAHERAPTWSSMDFLTSLFDGSAMDTGFDTLRHGDKDVIDEEAQRRMRLVIPHIRRAAKIVKRIDFEAGHAAALASTLDALSAGMCLILADGHVVHTNTAFQEILASVDFLAVVGGQLVAADAEVDRNLHELFASIDTCVTPDVRGSAWPLKSSDGENYVVHVLPLTSDARRSTGVAAKAVAVLFLCKARMTTFSSPEMIATHYKLTPTELRVLLGILEVGGVPEVADALGIAHTTVKTHLGRLFAKTGTNRQADLVKIVAGFSTPFLARV